MFFKILLATVLITLVIAENENHAENAEQQFDASELRGDETRNVRQRLSKRACDICSESSESCEVCKKPRKCNRCRTCSESNESCDCNPLQTHRVIKKKIGHKGEVNVCTRVLHRQKEPKRIVIRKNVEVRRKPSCQCNSCKSC